MSVQIHSFKCNSHKIIWTLNINVFASWKWNKFCFIIAGFIKWNLKWNKAINSDRAEKRYRMELIAINQFNFDFRATKTHFNYSHELKETCYIYWSLYWSINAVHGNCNVYTMNVQKFHLLNSSGCLIFDLTMKHANNNRYLQIIRFGLYYFKHSTCMVGISLTI